MRLGATVLLVASVASPGIEAREAHYLCFFAAAGTSIADTAAPGARCLGILAEAYSSWQRAHDGTAQTSTVPPQALPAQTYLVEVHGLDDVEADPRESLRRSVARASAVAEALIRLGLPAGVISIHGHGSAQPLMPATGAEPQNRRVCVIFRLPGVPDVAEASRCV